MSLLVNPSAQRLGVQNAVLWGRGRSRYHVREFPGPLSVKAVVRGAAQWRIGARDFVVDRNTWLIVNDEQPYSITIDSRHAVETFCVFFERGYVEDAYRTLTSSHEALLMDPFLENLPVIGFSEYLRPCDDRVQPLLHRLHGSVAVGKPSNAVLAELAESLVLLRAEVPLLMARVPAVEAATRAELFRRAVTARHWLDENFAEGVDLKSAARAACLSPFHFQRLFKAVFQETPQRYVARRRLDTAARLLRETDLPVTGICLDTGHESPSTFSTLFRSRFGFSPRGYRMEFARSKKFFGAI